MLSPLILFGCLLSLVIRALDISNICALDIFIVPLDWCQSRNPKRTTRNSSRWLFATIGQTILRQRAMNPNDLLNKFTQQFATVIGPGLDSLGADVRQQIRLAAQSAFEKMDLVSREEFEAQKAVLLRSRQKLEDLEKRVAELEALATAARS